MNYSVSPDLEKPSAPKKKNWFIPIIIACIIGIWSALAGLFFFAVVWVLRLDPGADASFTISNNDKKTAKRVYTWLFWSPIFTVLIFIGTTYNLSSTSTVNDRVLAALVPLILHLPLLLGLTSKSRFVYRHTQQGILLIALRAGMASLVAVTLENYSDYAFLLFFFGNGLLWLFGGLISWSQISNNKCWFMERKGEKIILSGSSAPKSKELAETLKSSDTKGTHPDREQALRAFRTGTLEMKKNAVAVLVELGEVEKF